MFSFTMHTGWTEIEDVLVSGPMGSFEDELDQAGFVQAPCLVLGLPEDLTFSVEVYSRKAEYRQEGDFQFLAHIQLGGETESVLVYQMPDLITLLNQLLPLIGIYTPIDPMRGVPFVKLIWPQNETEGDSTNDFSAC